MARDRIKRVVFTFHTTTMAMKMEQESRRAGRLGRLIPVPRQISAGCGMAWSAPVEDRKDLELLIRARGIEAEGIHELLL